ncbi:UPF0016-domain-containing protein [Xylariaceae sp. FL0255]|nr:UPF0016-domain-containing protein [Xylariaceae sp. FL0255]
MKIRQPHTLLLLLPSLALAVSISSSSKNKQSVDYRVSHDASYYDDDALSLDAALGSSSKSKLDVGTKLAPVDGVDGVPHEGPFVTLSDKTSKKGRSSLAADEDASYTKSRSKTRPADDSNDGVMDDPNRKLPKQGTTGTEGGISEKTAARLAKEGRTGEKAENVPETPKEKPPSPHPEIDASHSDKELKKEKDTTKSDSSDDSDDFSGLEKPSDLPDKLHDNPNPLPHSANKDHLDLSKSSKSGSKTSTSSSEPNDGLIQPFHSFVLSLTMILVSEVGDKTFLVAALMAMKHDRILVFTAAFGALLVMTVLSAVLGHTLPALIPKRLTSFLAAGLFFVFGAKLLREGMGMDPNEGVSAEMQEVEMELQEKEHQSSKGRRSSVSPYTLEMGLNNHDRKPRSQGRFPTPPRSASTSPGRSLSPAPGALAGVSAGLSNLFSLLLSPAWVQTFVMTFLGEWGDRSQIATIAMAAGQDYWWVTLGAMVGHACCTGVAVIGGRAIAGKVSLKVVTMGGAIAFLVFGFIYLVEGFYA